MTTLGANLFQGSLFFLPPGARERPEREVAMGDGVNPVCGWDGRGEGEV